MSEQKAEYVTSTAVADSLDAANYLNHYSALGYEVVTVTPLATRDGELQRVLFTMRQRDAGPDAAAMLASLSEKVDTLDRLYGQVQCAGQDNADKVQRLQEGAERCGEHWTDMGGVWGRLQERVATLERRIAEIQALNSSRAVVINDQGERIEKLEARLLGIDGWIDGHQAKEQ